MLVIKFHLCACLFCAWTQSNERKAIICKGWEKASLLQSFNPNFQMEALGMNELLKFYFHPILHKKYRLVIQLTTMILLETLKKIHDYHGTMFGQGSKDYNFKTCP
jgi:hypothetical protein